MKLICLCRENSERKSRGVYATSPEETHTQTPLDLSLEARNSSRSLHEASLNSKSIVFTTYGSICIGVDIIVLG